MVQENYRQKLVEVHTEISNNIKNATDYSIIMDEVKKEFSMFSDIIRSFFIGREDGIKKIYEAIRNRSFPYNKITSIDVNASRFMYTDYLEGMIEYIQKVVDLKDTDTVNNEAVKNTNKIVRETDEEFILSILGGHRNEPSEMDIDTAMKNIEVLIDMNDDFNKILEISNTLIGKATGSGTSKYKEEVLEGIKAYFNSITLYNFKCIEEILKTYESIEVSMKNRTPVSGTKEVPTYQVF